MAMTRREVLAIAGAGIVGAAIPLAVAHFEYSPDKDWIVGEHGGKFGPDSDISDAFNKTIEAKGDSPGRVIVPYTNGTLYVGQHSLTIRDNTEVDFCSNTIKLQDGASKYLLRNDKTTKEISGRVVIKNATFDGNKRGGQTRRYDNATRDAVYGDIYDFRENYPGFCLVFDRVSELVVDNVTIIDSESWGIAHFLCDDAHFSNINVFTRIGGALNGDGITGVATSNIYINNLRGFTNDDMVGVSTSRATVQGLAIFNPRDGRDIQSVIIENIHSVKNNDIWSFVGVGLYFADDKKINAVSVDGIYGCFFKNILRMGNYWQSGAFCGIDNLSVKNLNSSSIMPMSADILVFSGQVNQLTVSLSKITRLLNDSSKYFNGDENAFICADGGCVQHVVIDNVSYYSEFLATDSESYNGIVVARNQGNIGTVIFDLQIMADIANNYTLLNKDNSNTDMTTISIESVLFNQPTINFAHITNAAGVAIGNVFNVKVTEPLDEQSRIVRAGNDAWIEGVLALPGGVAHVPSWCTPASSRFITCYKSDALEKRYTAQIDADGRLTVPNKPASLTKIRFDGAGWKI